MISKGFKAFVAGATVAFMTACAGTNKIDACRHNGEMHDLDCAEAKDIARQDRAIAPLPPISMEPLAPILPNAAQSMAGAFQKEELRISRDTIGNRILTEEYGEVTVEHHMKGDWEIRLFMNNDGEARMKQFYENEKLNDYLDSKGVNKAAIQIFNKEGKLVREDSYSNGKFILSRDNPIDDDAKAPATRDSLTTWAPN